MRNTPASPALTLTAYFEVVFIPAMIDGEKLGAGSRRGYAYIVHKFTAFAGRDIACREVTDELVDTFAASLISRRRYMESTAREHARAIRKVVRHWSAAQAKDQ